MPHYCTKPSAGEIFSFSPPSDEMLNQLMTTSNTSHTQFTSAYFRVSIGNSGKLTLTTAIMNTNTQIY
jgi:hypothetical protein